MLSDVNALSSCTALTSLDLSFCGALKDVDAIRDLQPCRPKRRTSAPAAPSPASSSTDAPLAMRIRMALLPRYLLGSAEPVPCPAV
ncbi:hypothetical protein TrVE_jg1053 [Triparma verrucosa]|uniref:Uncharacterized protein n=1 Tax=Triparma verrucosa TaxID=1606542 RepID=A0A9W7B371_9STRA|nr:hypothetical protein TrVE_jg1053 [Triparma verrucosa]